MLYEVITHYIASKIDIKELYLTADLETVTDGNLIDLPDNFQRDLKRCYNLYTFGWAKVYGSRSLLDSKLGRLDLSGNVDAVAKYSNQLYYQRLPSSAQGLRIYYRITSYNVCYTKLLRIELHQSK